MVKHRIYHRSNVIIKTKKKKVGDHQRERTTRTWEKSALADERKPKDPKNNITKIKINK